MEGEKGDGAMVIAAQTDNGGYTPRNIAEEGNTQETTDEQAVFLPWALKEGNW